MGDKDGTPLLGYDDDDDDEEEEVSENAIIDYGVGIRSLPFSLIPKQRLAFDDANLKRLIPTCHLRISIQDTHYKEDKRIWYTLDMEHGCFRWRVERRHRDFLQLHQQLTVYRTFLKFQIPDIKFEKSSERRRSSIVVRTKIIPKLPPFPLTPEALAKNKDFDWKMKALQSYVQDVLKLACYRNYHEMMTFLDIGPFSFIEELGPKCKEGFVSRRSNCGDSWFGLLCTVACGFWKKRWLFPKENFVALIDPSRGQLEVVVLVDRAFRTICSKHRTGHSDVVVVQNLNRRLILQCDSDRQARDWSEQINFAVDRGSADFVTPNRHESFAPPRIPTECKWIIDGATYFEAVALAMESAKEEIFITDWWLSPEIYLRRPTTHGHYWQLDYLLRRKAREGVRIFVLLYKELELALGINSFHTEQKLSRMHPNIQVLRHPYVSKGILLWAHHEKIVCVDQTYAFVGGLDLCYGRWDDYQHRLTDLGEVEEKLRVEGHMFPQYKSSQSELPTKKASSLPDVSVQENLELGEVQVEEKESSEENIKGTKLVTVLRKYQATKVFDKIRRALSAEELQQDEGESGKDLTSEQPVDRHRDVKEMALVHLGLERKFRLWHGKDYVNFISKDFQELELPYSDIIDRSKTPRMPWHDVGLYVKGMVARDVARHFILRWNQAKEENCPKDSSKQYLMPKCYSTLLDYMPPILLDTLGALYSADCQVLRSLSFWSGSISDTENSIHKAYLSVIRESKKYIYIENQFFISQPSGNNFVYNGIADALFNRILKAHKEEQDFHVFVVLPLLPAFEGEVGTGTGTLIQAITHWNYKSICRGSDSLKSRLARHMKNPSKYIGFYGLRTHGTLANKPVTELVYVHSKLLVADDRIAIIGSANINDRSLLGRRDSEIAIIVRDTPEQPDGAGQFCYSLRTALFKEHLGLMQEKDPGVDLTDPSKWEFHHNVWNNRATKNTKIYEEVFHCLPTDEVTNFADLKKYQRIVNLATTDPEGAKKKLKYIQGYLVMFPPFFLCDEKLEPQLTQMEHYLPSSIFT